MNLERSRRISALHTAGEYGLRIRSCSTRYGCVNNFDVRIFIFEQLYKRFQSCFFASPCPPAKDLNLLILGNWGFRCRLARLSTRWSYIVPFLIVVVSARCQNQT